MSFANYKLPLDYPPKEILRIYRDRLLVFGGVIIGNFLLLALIMFVMAQPMVSFIVVAFSGLTFFICWWASRNAVLARSHKKFAKTKIDLALDTEEVKGIMMALTALIGLKTDASGEELILIHKHIAFMAKDTTVQEFLEVNRSFQKYIIEVYLGLLADKYVTQNKKEELLRLANIVGTIYRRIGELLEKIPEQDLSVEIEPSLVKDKNGKLIIQSSLPFYMANMKTLLNMTRKQKVSYQLRFVREQILIAPNGWEMLGKKLLTKQGKEEVESIIKLLFQQREEIIKLTQSRTI